MLSFIYDIYNIYYTLYELVAPGKWDVLSTCHCSDMPISHKHEILFIMIFGTVRAIVNNLAVLLGQAAAHNNIIN